MKFEVDVLGSSSPNSPYGLRGLKPTVNLNCSSSELRRCVKVEVDALSFPSLIVRKLRSLRR